MTELFKIDIEFNPFAEKPIIVVPEEISIPLNSQILWRIKKIDHSVFREMKFNKGVSFCGIRRSLSHFTLRIIWH